MKVAHVLLLILPRSIALVTTSARSFSATRRSSTRVALRLNDDFDSLPSALKAMKALEPEDVSAQVQAQLWQESGRDPTYKVSGLATNEPTYTRLFTHATWATYTGKRPVVRWFTTTTTWLQSTILRAVFPVSLIASIWAFIVAGLPGVLLPRTSPVPMSLMGTALGLLLVFRASATHIFAISDPDATISYLRTPDLTAASVLAPLRRYE
jgi:hypothetical protein